jgi:hypothetical protein
MNEIESRRWDHVLVWGAIGWMLGLTLGFWLGANPETIAPSIVVFTVLFTIFGMLV